MRSVAPSPLPISVYEWILSSADASERYLGALVGPGKVLVDHQSCLSRADGRRLEADLQVAGLVRVEGCPYAILAGGEVLPVLSGHLDACYVQHAGARAGDRDRLRAWRVHTDRDRASVERPGRLDLEV